jgi:hypothetical protein
VFFSIWLSFNYCPFLPKTDVTLLDNQQCSVKAGRAVISCIPGYILDPTTNQCQCKKNKKLFKSENPKTQSSVILILLVIDNCQSYPCPMNSTCINQVNNFTCVCESGFAYNQVEKKEDDFIAH